MNKRLGTLIAALSLVAVTELGNAAVPTPQPQPRPAPCPTWKRCVPPPPPNPCQTPGPCRQIGSTTSDR